MSSSASSGSGKTQRLIAVSVIAPYRGCRCLVPDGLHPAGDAPPILSSSTRPRHCRHRLARNGCVQWWDSTRKREARPMAKRSVATRLVAPVAIRSAPTLTSGFVRQAFDRAVDGTGPLRGAAAAADLRLSDYDGNVGRAIGALVDAHVKLAGIQ